MQVIRTTIQPQSETYRSNYAANLAAVERLKAELARSTEGGGEEYNRRHTARDKLLPRERVEALLDEGSFFLELAPLAGVGMKGEHAGAGIVGGLGLVSGRLCLIIANEATVKGGAISEAGQLKNQRLSDIALQNRRPTVSLVESAGADLPVQHKIFVPGGRGFREITRRSKLRIPSVSVVFGNATAGGAYLPAISDYVVMVKRQAQVFLGGPPLVKMATGEVVDEESLGGAEMHSRVSGRSDYLAEDEIDALRIARVVDGSRFEEFKPLYGGTLVLHHQLDEFTIHRVGDAREGAFDDGRCVEQAGRRIIPLGVAPNFVLRLVFRERRVKCDNFLLGAQKILEVAAGVHQQVGEQVAAPRVVAFGPAEVVEQGVFGGGVNGVPGGDVREARPQACDERRQEGVGDLGRHTQVRACEQPRMQFRT